MEPKIQKTNRYGKFNTSDLNREVNEAHVRELIHTISEANLLPYNPIIVSKDLEVIDGQHRLEAAKRLKLDIYYVVAPNTSIKETRILNRANKSWFLMDYVRSYALSGNKECQILGQFCEEFDFPVSLALEMTSGLYTHRLTRNLKKGVVMLNDMDEAFDIAKKLKLIQPYCNKQLIRKRTMARAIKAMKAGGVDFDKLMEKLIQSERKLESTGNYRELLREFEDIINYKVKKNTTRLY